MNFTISDRHILHLWKASEIPHLDIQMGPSAGLDSCILWRRRSRQAPKFIALGANFLSVEAFTDGVMPSGSLIKLQINRGLRLIWSTEARREMRMVPLKSLMESSSVRAMLNPCWVCYVITPRQKAIDSGDRAEEWVPFSMAWRMVARDYSGPTSTGKPFSA